MKYPPKSLMFHAFALTAALYVAPAAAGCSCPYGGTLHGGALICVVPDGRGGMTPVGQAVCTSNNAQPYSEQPYPRWWSRGLNNKAIKVDPIKPGHVVGIFEPGGLHGSLGGGSGASGKPPTTFSSARSQACACATKPPTTAAAPHAAPKPFSCMKPAPCASLPPAAKAAVAKRSLP